MHTVDRLACRVEVAAHVVTQLNSVLFTELIENGGNVVVAPALAAAACVNAASCSDFHVM